MPTTSLKLPESQKPRVNAIAEQRERAEKRLAFIESALDAKTDFDQKGQAYEADAVHAYIRAKIQGKNPKAVLPKHYK
jgi:predicted transcriptional regulator